MNCLGDATEILLRLTQDVGLCPELIKAGFSSPQVARGAPKSTLCGETGDNAVIIPPDHHASWRPRKYTSSPCIPHGAQDLPRGLAGQDMGIPGG